MSKPSTPAPQRAKTPHAPSHAPHGPIQLKQTASGPSHQPASSSFSPGTPPHAYSSLLPHSSPPDGSHSALLGSLQSAYGNNFVQQVVQRKCHCGGSCSKCSGDDPSVQRKADGAAMPPTGLAAGPVPRGSAGVPLPSAVRAKMEQRFGQDFADVRIHDDPLAQQSAGSLNALAYTSGHDIYFAPGQYKPFSEEGERLLAHELTHVIQQRTGQVTSASTKLSSGGSNDSFELEADRAANGIHSNQQIPISSAPAGAVQRKPAALPTSDTLPAVSDLLLIPGTKGPVESVYAAAAKDGRLSTLAKFSRPGTETLRNTWSKKVGCEFPENFHPGGDVCEVDHIIELQVGGTNDKENLQLLEKSNNASSGSTLKSRVAEIAGRYPNSKGVRLTNIKQEPTVSDKCRAREAEMQSGGKCKASDKEKEVFTAQFGSKSVDIELKKKLSVTKYDISGRSNESVAGLSFLELEKTGDADGVIKAKIVGGAAKFQKNKGLQATITVTGGKAKFASGDDKLKLLFPFLSEADFDVSFGANGLDGQGKFNPSLPLLKKSEVNLKLEQGKFGGSLKVSAGQVQIPIPGVSITDCSLEATLVEEKFSAHGNLAFKISTFAEAKLTATVDSAGFAAKGVLDLHVPGLDKAQGTITYSSKKLAGDIEIGKDKFKLPRVKSASLHIHVTDTELTGTGVVELDVPGVKRGTLGITVDKAGDYLITGALSLSIPGLKTAEVSLTYAAGDLSGDATVGLDIPGLEGAGAAFKVHYAKGELSGSGQLSYKKGRLSGSIHAALSEKHKLSGGGELSYEIIPGLVATVDIDLLESGKTHVSGQLKIPDTINLFAENKIEKSLLSVSVQIPIFAIPLGSRSVGLVADIGADLKASAGIGPGQIRKLQVKASFDPGGDDSNFQFSGGGELYVPAYAVLALAVHGGIGLSIGIASATGGIELVSALGLRGALIAGVQINYQDKRFTVDASAELSAEPVLRFFINAYVKVEVFLIGEVYRKDWLLASKEWGSGLKIGLRFPVHYEFGKPFHIGLDQVEFIAPQIDFKKAIMDLLPI